MIAVYYRFICLPDEAKTMNKIKSKERLDCILFTDFVKGGYKGLTDFVNAKGKMFLYKSPARDIVIANSKRLTEWTLNNGSLNFSSVFIEDLDCPDIGYGYPNPNRLLSNGSPNPLFQFKNDGYLFIMNIDLTAIEVFIILDGRNLISSYYQKMIDGGFDDEIRNLREQAKPFFSYEGLVL